MADIRPLRAWRYAPELAPQIESLTSPLFDVVSEKQREALYREPLSSIHISVPRGEHPHLKAKETLASWKANKTIQQDELPGIYVYYQYFTLPGGTKEYTRKGFICNIRAYDWDRDRQIMRHENTMPHSVNDRITLLEETQLNVSPTHGLYTDPEYSLEPYMDEAIQAPIYETEDYQGVRDVLGVIHDAEVIGKFMALLEAKQVILADGHHRYESSMVYRQQKMAENPNHTGEEGYNWHLMYLTNSEADDLRILPTHRVIEGLEGLEESALMEKLSEDFIIKPLDNPYDVNEIILGKKYAFGLLFKDNVYKIRLKPERYQDVPWNFPDAINQLDLTVMHYFVIEKALGIEGRLQRSSRNITFDRSFPSCVDKVHKGKAQLAIIMKDVSMEQVKEVCQSGYTMPQKSTYFYPKVICGFLFSSIADEDFTFPPRFSF